VLDDELLVDELVLVEDEELDELVELDELEYCSQLSNSTVNCTEKYLANIPSSPSPVRVPEDCASNVFHEPPGIL